MLIVTPIVPVVLSAASFFVERDKPFVLVSLLVLAVLAERSFLGTTIQ
ncbi:MAG: DUF1634 domain-containing protein [Chloroflexi bacterium]|nr:DUF1634 domain-containing protein [Chloroflexota bacterium]